MLKQRSQTVPAAMQPTYDQIVALTDPFCKEHLSDECAVLCRELAAALARKRPSPITRGKPEIWACAIVHALAMVNFLFDPTQTPHIRAPEMWVAFGVSQSSTVSKSKFIRDLFNMMPLDPNWCLPSRMDQNPIVWYLMINGLMVDIRHMPREAQQVAYEKGLIPYIPADRQAEQ